MLTSLANRLRSNFQTAMFRGNLPLDRGGGPTVLFVANDLIPTLQLSFLTPLREEVSAGRIATPVWVERDMRRLVSIDVARARLAELAPTCLIFCRYSGMNSENLVAACRQEKIPVVYHIDDDLLNVPASFGEKKFKFHNDPARLAAVRYLMNEADLVYAANSRLAKHIGGLANVRAIYAGPIYCSSRVLCRPHGRAHRRIGYMGFDHVEDFAVVAPAIAELMKRDAALTFTMIGPVPIPQSISRFGNRVSVVAPIRDYQEFRQRLADEAWDVGLCPLVPTHFNMLKSDTKWVEYTSSGMAVVASAGTIYDYACADGCGALVENSTEAWRTAIERLVNSNDARITMVAAAQEKVERAYSPEALRQQILTVLEQAKHCIAVSE